MSYAATGILSARQCLHDLHRDAEDRRLKQRQLNRKRERGENLVNVTVGDFVQRFQVDESNGNKLLVTWIGPHPVVRADACSFRVQHPVNGEELDVHASRLKVYADSSLNVTDELWNTCPHKGLSWQSTSSPHTGTSCRDQQEMATHKELQKATRAATQQQYGNYGGPRMGMAIGEMTSMITRLNLP
ncbi:unnamed protein product [Phytophthora fragariaefolia]|uniref:Unnamed protein product n=1 Tax=Phytophthora fragariaefolia TaxID=1490495 RepID=A0A9W6TVX5_9STRA|nr:unnamed protein product [Phytophthora fragariaefolia]